MPEQKPRRIIGVMTDKFVYFEVGSTFNKRQPCNPENWGSDKSQGILGSMDAADPTIVSIGLCPVPAGTVPAWAQINLSDGKTIIAYHLHDVIFSPELNVERLAEDGEDSL